MASSLLSDLYLTTNAIEGQRLAAFTTEVFADLLRTVPGLASRLFGDLGPIPRCPAVLTAVPATADTHLALVVEGEEGFHLLIENRLAAEIDWFEERVETRMPSHSDKYIAAAKHRYGGAAKVIVLARTHPDLGGRRYPVSLFAGSRTWSRIYEQLEASLPGGDPVIEDRIRQFLHFLKDHDMNASEPLSQNDAEVILAFDRFARNNLKLLDDAVGRIRQEFDLRSTPNNRRMTGWYVCSDRFQSDEIHFFFYLMFPPVPDLVARASVQVTKESSPRGFAAASEHGFRRGRWGSVWMERDYKRNHPLLSLPSNRQVEELVRFFQTPLARLSRSGFVNVAPARHEDTARAPHPRLGDVPAPPRGTVVTEIADQHEPSPDSLLPGDPNETDGPDPSTFHQDDETALTTD